MADSILQEIKDRLDIADVIGGYIQLKKAGSSFKALCPFHGEKTPSFQISPQKQIWHCFGCGEGGDIFTFVQKIENLEFRDVKKILAAKAGINLPEYRLQDAKAEEEKDRLLRINDFASRFYNEILNKDKRASVAREYLEKRGLTAGTIKQWRVGYAPDEFHFLEQAMLSKKVSIQDLVKSGLSSKNERGQIYDRFRGRVTFPIFDYLGNVVGFSARVLDADAKVAKYINSPETLVYSKSKELFGLNFAKESIRKKDEAVIVEGQMDCISAHQAGFTNTVASSGTALTELQLIRLGKLTKNLKFCFDADKAGQIASRRAGELALQKGFKLRLIVLKSAKDPDEQIRKSPGVWEKEVLEAQRFLDYYINFALQEFGKDLVAQKNYLSQQVVPFLGFIADPLEQDHYVHELVSKFNISEKVLRAQIKHPKQNFSELADAQVEVVQANALEKNVLGGMLVFPEFLQEVVKTGGVTDFTNTQIQTLVMPLFEGKLLPEDLAQSSLAKEVQFMVESEIDSGLKDKASVLRDLNKDFVLLRLQAIKRRQLELASLIKSAESKNEIDLKKQLNREFAELNDLRTVFEKKL